MNALTKLSRHQFHTVWTTASKMDGYNKNFFVELEKQLEKDGVFIVLPISDYDPKGVSKNE